MTFSSPVLVTGAAGFIGAHVVQRLIQLGRRVIGVDNLNPYYDVRLKRARLAHIAHEDFTLIEADIADRAAMEKLWAEQGPFTQVVHLAAQAGVRYSLTNPYDYITSNCMGHLTILEMCRHTAGFQHLVYASSSSVYGNNSKLPYAVGDAVDQPISLYAATKRSDELFSHTYSHLYKIPQTGLRFFTVYGPWGRPDMAPYLFTSAIAEGRPISVFNHGRMKRDFTYIDDIVSGVVAAIERPPEGELPCRIFNLGNHRSENLMDFIGAIESALGRKAIIDFKDMQPGDIPETFADIEATTQALGYEPLTTISDGVPRFVEWYKAYSAGA